MSLIEISQLEFVFRVALGAQYSKTLLVPEGRLLKYVLFEDGNIVYNSHTTERRSED